MKPRLRARGFELLAAALFAGAWGREGFAAGAPAAARPADRPKVVQEAVAPVRFVRKDAGWYFVDFGRDAFGTVTLDIPSPVDGQAVTVGMGEAASGPDTVNAAPGGSVRYQSQTLTLRHGVTHYKVTPQWKKLYDGYITPPDDIGQVAPFRYVEIRNVPEPFTASQIRQLAAHVPFDDAAASFTSPDARLNETWELCKYSIKATSFLGVYVDGDRERKPYEADAYINQLSHYCVDRDYATAHYTHEYLLTHSTWPTEWVMHSVFMAWMDYLYTGDARSLEANYAALQAKLLPARARPDGLYAGDTRGGSGPQPTDIVDWPPVERDGYDMTLPVKTVTSAFRCQSLEYMRGIAAALGKTADAAAYQADAARTRDSINAKLWDPANQRYVDGMNDAGKPGTHASLHANMFPLAFGIVPPERQAGVVAFIKSRGMVCSVYGAQYLFDALYAAGEGDYALSLLNSTGKRSWHNMSARAGSTITMEAWDASLKPNLDWNHAWGAAAANLIPRWLMGVRPLEPGFRKILIQPQPGNLPSASLTTPTIRGPVSVRVLENTAGTFSLSVTIPGNTSARVGLPALASASAAVTIDGVPGSGTLDGKTLWIDGVMPGTHRFERRR